MTTTTVTTAARAAKTTIDLNSDLGEDFGAWTLDNDALLDVVTSANIACGFHAGDPPTMRRVCRLAVAKGVRIGAHVGYRDLAGFGRRRMDIAPDELADDVIYQIGALDAFARDAGDRVRYVKPHGALYNTIVYETVQAAAVVDAVRRYDPTLAVLGPPRSQWLRLAENAGLTVISEAFADRAYAPDGRLVSRSQPGAVVHDVDSVVGRTVRMAIDGTVESVTGTEVDVSPRSICVHGDTPGAVELAHTVRDGLLEAGIQLASFV